VRDGTVALERLDGTSSPKVLGSTWVEIDPSGVDFRVHAEGPRIRVLVDGVPVIDAVDDGPPLEEGGLALLVYGGRARFDDLALETSPSLYPTVAVKAGVPTPLAAGFELACADPDGARDLARVTLELDKKDGHGFQDVTFLLATVFDLFEHRASADGKGGTARLKHTIAVPSGWVLRFSTADHDGNAESTELVLR